MEVFYMYKMLIVIPQSRMRSCWVFGLRNSTIFNNKGGYVASILENDVINNNITMIYNDAGLYLQAPKWISTPATDTKPAELENGAFISNSIIAKNNKNCVIADSNDSSVIQSSWRGGLQS